MPDAGSAKARRLRWNPALIAGVVLLGGTGLTVLIASLVIGDGAARLSADIAQPASGEHWLGTDYFGRDQLARALVGAEASLIMALAATVISMSIGVLAGAAVWTAPRRVRELALRFVEITVSYPELLVAVVLAAILGAGRWQLVVAVAVANIPATARLTANLSGALYQRDFVTTARLSGVPRRAVIGRHLLPNMAEPLLIQVAAAFSTGLVAMSALSFVGLGVQTPDFDLGRLLADALPSIYSRPLEVVGPTLLILLLSVGAMLIGDGLAAAVDPRVRRRTTARAETPAGSAPGASTAPVVVRDLAVARADGTPLVRGVSFEIGRGEIVGLVGESGSGKSLTALSLARLLPEGLTATASELRAGGIDLLGRPTRRELADTVAMVYQDPGTTFNPALRMGTQLTEVLRVHRGLSKSAARSVITDLLAKVHITDPERVLRAHPYELSGGMRQRAMIAAALAAEPALLVADEPTTALDTTVAAGILRELGRIRDETGTSILFISHDLGVVEELCDRVLVMKDGEIVEELTCEALRAGAVTAPYTRMLLDSVPRLAVRS
ncbi:ATP-binding cassette domain-containing protein [Actinophytocola algeriensis]|uniref:ABC-type dipeptide/oligopeptide/nickel transport system ATPase component/ABC-type dipeptide/oligopeptide/nickel transport system permease subunit n=1 Tax=Actinophytocola algeriensis TaxID=1768010 RepID=A0A7W7Q7K6_9PSEU|nr:dipeptide/oligopeptide/nickel ABC transporter permease/ATP-binding protein [Actinophytocola algeriensis]MBB4908556.1 ABC-type dipeptide/oligopeptide/nickel transport system ATPase component/ABC-type dipeptide/oligopeptide/nickel transport system permease subunit [Actinophytocola algeriensis]MBE1475057.1 ABC-type dipeptide/oligopeptide/nickel transport system ATPase component/ABC-type dipeptide/oligopeptide/nickel transport system permease subunit [Actinophytocola algeriensis]